jgi:hypothetical protein
MEKFATKNYIMEYVSVDEVIGAKKEENNW